METNQDGSEVLETTEETVEETETEETTEDTEEVPALSKQEVEELRAKAAKADELEKKNKQLYERAKKNVPSKDPNLSPKDYLALTNAGITAEDFDEVVRVSTVLGKPISEALRDDVMKTILDRRAEERRTAAATHTSGGARAVKKTTGEDLLRKAEATGEIPDDEDGMAKVINARMERKRENIKRRRN